MTDRDLRLQSFLTGDLQDAQKALTYALASNVLQHAERVNLEQAHVAIHAALRSIKRRQPA